MKPEEQRALLAEYTDLLRLALAGNLREYELLDAVGQVLPGRRLLYNGVPAAYAVFPEESVHYAACHDNETLFDQVHPLHLVLGFDFRYLVLGLVAALVPAGVGLAHG